MPTKNIDIQTYQLIKAIEMLTSAISENLINGKDRCEQQYSAHLEMANVLLQSATIVNL